MTTDARALIAVARDHLSLALWSRLSEIACYNVALRRRLRLIG